MQFEGQTTLPDEIIDNAITTHLYSNRSTIDESMLIYQRDYAQKHGDFSVETTNTGETVVCTLHVNENSHSCEIPLQHEPTTVEVYPYGEVQFENIELLSVSLRADFPWTKEAFVVSYWADPVGDDLNDSVKENSRILHQYYPPREVTDDNPLPEIVGHGEKDGFKSLGISTYTHAATPNPWSKHALMVLYENKELAEQLLTHDEVHMPKDQYERTPPEETQTR